MWGLIAADDSVILQGKRCESPAARLGASGLIALNNTLKEGRMCPIY